MGPQRLDRRDLRDRLAPDHPGWITDELADAFEGPFLTFQRQVADAKKKRKKTPVAAERRTRQGRPVEEGDE